MSLPDPGVPYRPGPTPPVVVGLVEWFDRHRGCDDCEQGWSAIAVAGAAAFVAALIVLTWHRKGES